MYLIWSWKVLTWDQIGCSHSSRRCYSLSSLSLWASWDWSVFPVTLSRTEQVEKTHSSFLIREELGGGNVCIPSIWRQVKHQGGKIWTRCRRYLSAQLFPSLPSSFFIRCCLIYSGLRWHRGLDPVSCQTKPPQCSRYYSDRISALTPMRSPPCYVSPTEKYSHAEKDAVLWVEVLLYWCCTDKGNTHTHTQCSHISRHAQKGLLCVHWDFFFFLCFWDFEGWLHFFFFFFNRKTRAHSPSRQLVQPEGYFTFTLNRFHLHVKLSYQQKGEIIKHLLITVQHCVYIIWSQTTELLLTHPQHAFLLILNNITCLTAVQEYCVRARPAASGHGAWLNAHLDV